MPGHLICLEPALLLYNLLPIELRYKFLPVKKQQQQRSNTKDPATVSTSGRLDPYKYEQFRHLDMGETFDLLLDPDNYRMARTIEINPAKHLGNLNHQHHHPGTADSDSNSHQRSNAVDSPSTSSSTAAASAPSAVTLDHQLHNQGLTNKKLTILRRIDFVDEKSRPLFLIARIIFKIGSYLLLERSTAAAAPDDYGQYRRQTGRL